MKLLIVTQKIDQNDQVLGFFISWLNEFAKYSKKVNVLCLEKSSFSLPDNVIVRSLGKDSGQTKLRQLYNFYRAIFALRKEYDSVFVHMNPIWVVVGGLFWRAWSKRIGLWYTHKSVTLKLRVAEKLASVIFTASAESFRISSPKVVVTGHGIDTDIFKPPNVHSRDGGLKILSVGRIAPIKNLEVLIDAARILKSMNEDFYLTIVGEPILQADKVYQAELEKKVSMFDLKNHVKFVGKILNRDLPTEYQSHDIFVQSSRTGSVDKIVLEAMACGMKVLSSNDASRAFLPPEYIFNDGNAQELAQKIKSLRGDVADDCLREYVVEHHNLKKLIAKLISYL